MWSGPPSPHTPPGGSWQHASSPKGRRAQCSFQGSPQLPEAEHRGGSGLTLTLLWDKHPSSGSKPGAGKRNRETQAPAHLCPTSGGWEGQKAIEQPRLRKTSPSCGVCPSPVCSAWVLGWGPGKGEEEAGRTHGAGCRPLLSWRGSKSNILQGRYFPCSAHAQFKRPLCSSKRASGLLFLMHTVKGKKITVIHLLRARGH